MNKEYLDEQVELINTTAFIKDDPVQFPRRYNELQDIEIVAFVISTISWGKREMILRDSERLLAKLGDSPYDFVMNEDYKMFGKANIHRTFFEPDLVYMLRCFRQILEKHDSIEDFLKTFHLENESAPAWHIAKNLRSEAIKANNNEQNVKCFSGNFESSALKRMNLALRWLVRNDGIVDLGVWTILKPSQLYIPLDIHVGNTSRRLNLLTRKNNDRKAVEELTSVLGKYCPEDPVKYDFALFGIGIKDKKQELE